MNPESTITHNSGETTPAAPSAEINQQDQEGLTPYRPPRTASSRMRAVGTLALIFAFLLTPIATLLAVLYMTPDTPDGARAHPTPILIPLAEAKTVGQAAQARARWSKGPPLSAPSWSGLVTRVYVRGGQSIATGTRIIQIDGIDRIAIFGRSPFYRPLAPGTHGSDVRALNSALVELGFLSHRPPYPDTYSRQTATAVRRLAQQIGASLPPGSAAVTFEPAWVVWLPGESVHVGSVSATVGQPAPPAGQAVVESSARLTTLTVDQSTLAAGIPPGPLSLTVYGHTVKLDNDLAVTDSAVLSEISTRINVGTTSVPVLVAASSTDKQLLAPVTAVITDPAGRTCVWQESGSGFAPVRVRVSGGDPGLARVIGSELAVGDEVLANPSAVVDDLRC